MKKIIMKLCLCNYTYMYFKDFIHSFIRKSASKRTWVPGTWFGFMVDENTHACWVGELWKNASSEDTTQLI
ncbi:unnamed protein product [Trifolium pratense]|uniref:Uncharacterized protein n=1 Tax=Trifolium pratense TaxID=57577 RepID=A0ACB0M2B5_TRIPR|nr:unnamed protein product [Trifolium pratense]